jgi:hypothetical protein
MQRLVCSLSVGFVNQIVTNYFHSSNHSEVPSRVVLPASVRYRTRRTGPEDVAFHCSFPPSDCNRGTKVALCSLLVGRLEQERQSTTKADVQRPQAQRPRSAARHLHGGRHGGGGSRCRDARSGSLQGMARRCGLPVNGFLHLRCVSLSLNLDLSNSDFDSLEVFGSEFDIGSPGILL